MDRDEAIGWSAVVLMGAAFLGALLYLSGCATTATGRAATAATVAIETASASRVQVEKWIVRRNELIPGEAARACESATDAEVVACIVREADARSAPIRTARDALAGYAAGLVALDAVRAAAGAGVPLDVGAVLAAVGSAAARVLEIAATMGGK